MPQTTLLDAIGRTPLVPLRAIGQGLPVPVLVKCEHMNPGGSVKDRIALAIVDDAERRGLLRPGDTLIEATAGNTGMGLAVVAAVRGYRLVCVLPEKMSVDKRTALAAVGARVVVTPNAPPDSPDNFQNVARRMAARGALVPHRPVLQPGQRSRARGDHRPGDPRAVRRTHRSLRRGRRDGRDDTGVGRLLKKRAPNAKIVLADPVGSGLARWVVDGVVGADAPYLVEGIGTSKPPAILDRTVIDAAESVSDEESFAMVKRLVREEGLLVGGSSGTNVVAALRVAKRGGLDGPVVTVLPDGWDRYRAQPWMQEW